MVKRIEIEVDIEDMVNNQVIENKIRYAISSMFFLAEVKSVIISEVNDERNAKP
jgi:hypothetical protein